MPQDLTAVAVRVVRCLLARPRREPDPADVEQLRNAVSEDKRDWDVRLLATHVLHQCVMKDTGVQ
jgi:hypothetical protein